MGCGQRLFHAVLQARQLAHRIVTAKQKEQESDELSRVHPSGDDLLLADKEQQNYEQNPDDLDGWRRRAGDAGTSQVGPQDSFRYRGKTIRLTLLCAIGFNDALVGECLLRGVCQLFASLKTLAREGSQCFAELDSQHSDDRSDDQGCECQSPTVIKGRAEKCDQRKTFAQKIAERRRHSRFNRRGAGNESRDEVVRAVALKKSSGLR